MLYFIISLLAKILLDSISAAFFRGPKTLKSSFSNSSAIPSANGFSGPTTISSIFSLTENSIKPLMLSGAISTDSEYFIMPGFPCVANKSEGEDILKDFYEGNFLNEAAFNFIIEEFIEGEEVSVFAICDGTDFIVLPYSQDHKKISDGEKGKNTGGMGAVAPVKKFMTEDLNEKIKSKIITQVLNALKSEGREYKGCLYCGLMIKDNEPFVIEFNSRFGDPETQAVLPLIKSDFLEMLYSASTKNLKNYVLEVNDLNTCCVVIASGGYPDKFETGKKISGTEELDDNCLLFHSATKSGNDEDKEELVTAGGRVLSVVGISDTSPEEAIKSAYENVNKISFENKYFRKDIGFRIVNKNGV